MDGTDEKKRNFKSLSGCIAHQSVMFFCFHHTWNLGTIPSVEPTKTLDYRHQASCVIGCFSECEMDDLISNFRACHYGWRFSLNLR